MKYQAGRQPYIVLRSVEKVGVNVVSLQAPSEQVEKAVVDAAANSGGDRCIGSEAVRIDVGEPDESFSKGSDLAHGNTQSRSDQEIIKMGVDADWGAHDSNGAETGRAGKFQIAVVGAEI